MYEIQGQTIDQHLLRLAERGNAAFAQRLHPGIAGVLGIRIPDLRQLAKDILRSGTQEAYLEEAEAQDTNPNSGWMEARTLHGLVLSQWRITDAADYLQRVARWIPHINSWSVCDVFSFAGGKRFVAAHEAEIWSFVEAYFSATSTYEIRFAVVMSLQYFAKPSHVEQVLSHLAAITHEDYYVRMAVAWAVAECFTHCPEETRPWLAENHLPTWTHNKTIQKIRESNRIDTATKSELLAMKRKA